MQNREKFLQDRAQVFKKVYGSLSGLAIGDSLGDAARKQENRANYAITTDFCKGASWSTDDTEFALLTAKTLIRCKGKLTRDECVKSWMEDVVVQDEYKRGGASEIEAANNLRKGILPPLSGKYNAFSQSDGACMRIAPIGIFCAGDVERAKELAQTEAQISHDRDGVWGAQAVAAAVAAAMVDASFEEIFNAAFSAIPSDSWLHYSMTSVLSMLAQSGNIWDIWMDIHDFLWTSSWATTAEAIPSAFVCLQASHNDFRSGVTLAANFGRDADTIGAVVGAILGAKYGISCIPPKWVERTRYPTGTCLKFTSGLDIREYAEKITDIMCSEL